MTLRRAQRAIAAALVMVVVPAGVLYALMGGFETPVTADQLAREPAMTNVYPGAFTPPGLDPGTVSSEELPRLDTEVLLGHCRGKGCGASLFTPYRRADASRQLVVAATRAQVLAWYRDHFLSDGWNVHSFYADSSIDLLDIRRDHYQLLVQLPHPAAPPAGSVLARQLAGGRRLTAFSVTMAYDRTRSDGGGDGPAGAEVRGSGAIDLSPCAAGRRPASIALSGAVAGTAELACADPRRGQPFRSDCGGLVGGPLPTVLDFSIGASDVWWTEKELVVTPPYGSDTRSFGFLQRAQMNVTTGTVRLRESFGDDGGATAVTIDATAPCTSFTVFSVPPPT